MLTLKKILTGLIVGSLILTCSPTSSHAFGLPAIDVGALVQAVKRAITDVQNADQLIMSTKAAKGIQSALGKFNESMNGFIKGTLAKRIADLKNAKVKYEAKLKAAKNNKWVQKGVKTAQKVGNFEKDKQIAQRIKNTPRPDRNALKYFLKRYGH